MFIQSYTHFIRYYNYEQIRTVFYDYGNKVL